MQSFNKCLLIAYYVTGSVPGAKDTEKTKVPALDFLVHVKLRSIWLHLKGREVSLVPELYSWPHSSWKG